MTAAIYARVSTEDQSVEQQLDRLRKAAPGAMEYVDAGWSGKAADRPSFKRMREEVAAKRIDTVYTVKLDRLGRSVANILDFFQEMESAGARVVILDQSIDTSTPMGKLLRTILAAVAELEADLISERTQAAMDAFKNGTRKTKTGRPVGRPRKVTPDLARRIHGLRQSGLKWREIALRVHLPAGTCRKVALPQAGEIPIVENGPVEFGAQGAAQVPNPPRGQGGG